MSSPLSSSSAKIKAALNSSPSPRSPSINSVNSSDMDPSRSDIITDSTPNTSTSSADLQKRIVAEIIAESFASFDHQASIVGPYEDDQKRDADFREQLASKILSVLFKSHAWATSRPTQESQGELVLLEKDINDVIAIEQEQEHTRERLRDFVERIKVALAALSGFGSL